MLALQIQNQLNQVKKSVLVLDIETAAFYSDGREISIKTNFDDYVAHAKVKWFGCYSFKNNQGYYLNAQKEAIQIKTLLNTHEVIVGFNSSEFDFPILVNNGLTNPQIRYNQVDVMQILGTSNQRNKKGYAYKNRGGLMDYDFKNNSLRCMAETMKLEHQKGDLDYHIFQKDEWTEQEVLEIKKYLYNDVMATKQMFERLWNYWLPFAELLTEKHIYDLSWIKSSIASLTYKAACKVLNTEPTYSDKTGTSEEMGGNVIIPTVEEATGAWYVDFQSLYPHIFCQFNLPAEVSNPSEEGMKTLWHGNKIFEVKGYYDVSKWHPLSEYIASKLKERIHLKEHDKASPFIYTLKIFLNGLYGCFRSEIFEKIHTPNCGWDCCWLGKQIQQLAKELLEQFGFTIIAGDTDSLMFLTNDKDKNTKEYVLNCLNEIVDVIKSNVPFPVDTFKIGIEKYLEYIMFPFEDAPVVGEDGKNIKVKNRLVLERKGKRKNYLYIYKDDKGESQVQLVGLPIKKNNATALGIKIYDEVLKAEIIKNNRAKFPKSFLEGIINDYLKKPEIIDLLSVEYRVNPSNTYKTNCIQKQIADAYFKGQEGVIRLVKNSRVGKCGKGTLYATVEEVINAKLTSEELDLSKVRQELSPFILYEELLIKDKKEEENIDVRNTETGVEYTVSKDCLEACKDVLEPIKRQRGRPKKETPKTLSNDYLPSSSETVTILPATKDDTVICKLTNNFVDINQMVID